MGLAQARLFDNQPDMFGSEPAPVYRPDAEKVRRRLHNILLEMRAVQDQPLKPTRLSLYRSIFPQMALFLPEEEAAQLRFEFAQEMQRLAKAA